MSSCHACGVPLDSDAIALNLRLRGRAVGHLDCIPCLADRLDSPERLLYEWIDYFKRTRCILFQSHEKTDAGRVDAGGADEAE